MTSSTHQVSLCVPKQRTWSKCHLAHSVVVWYKSINLYTYTLTLGTQMYIYLWQSETRIWAVSCVQIHEFIRTLALTATTWYMTFYLPRGRSPFSHCFPPLPSPFCNYFLRPLFSPFSLLPPSSPFLFFHPNFFLLLLPTTWDSLPSSVILLPSPCCQCASWHKYNQEVAMTSTTLLWIGNTTTILPRVGKTTTILPWVRKTTTILTWVGKTTTILTWVGKTTTSFPFVDVFLLSLHNAISPHLILKLSQTEWWWSHLQSLECMP